MGIKPYKIKKTELIRLIQQAEKSMVCYGTERVSYCHEDKSLITSVAHCHAQVIRPMIKRFSSLSLLGVIRTVYPRRPVSEQGILPRNV